MNWKGYGKNSHSLKLRYYPHIHLEGPKKNHEKSQSVLLVSGPKFEARSAEYKAGVLCT
jgi:hypothetical protein